MLSRINRSKQMFEFVEPRQAEIDTTGSTFLQKLAGGEKIFVSILQPKYMVDYASKLKPFLNSRGIEILKVDRTRLKINTSCGDIWFCVESDRFRTSPLHRDKFLLGRHDFTEFYAWEDWVDAKN